MSLEGSPPTRAIDKDAAMDEGKHGRTTSLASDLMSQGKGEVFSLEDVDPALNAKMRLVNNVRQPPNLYGVYLCSSLSSLI